MENKNIQSGMVGNKVWGNITYKNEQAFELSGETQSDRQIESVFTPIKIVKDMIDVLDSEVVDELGQSYFESQGILNKRILDIYCKSGRFLSEIRDRFFRQNQYKLEYEESLENHIIDNRIYDKTDTSRKQFIINNNLFGICPDEMTRLISQREVAGDPFSGNFRVVKENSGINKTGNSLFQAVQEIRFEIPDNNGGTKTVEFDTVVGNPPYNGGGDIDFVIRGFNISKSYVLMITPAKWQTAEADQAKQAEHTYKEFRQVYQKYMKYICFYPDTSDIFNIQLPGGVSYFLMNKKVNDYCRILNKMSKNSLVNSDKTRRLGLTLWNIGNDVLELLKNYKTIKLEQASANDRYICKICDMLQNKRMWNKTGDTVYCCEPQVDLALTLGKYKCLKEFDSYNEANSYKQYIDTKLCRFLMLLGYTEGVKDKSFRFIPEPLNCKYDHIFTDNEVYKMFNIPNDYITVINSLIKDR